MIKYLLLLLLSLSLVYAEHVRWFGNYSKALSIAKKEGKPMMVFLVEKECQLCRDTIKKYFMGQPYIELFNLKVVSVIVVNNGKASYPIELYYSTIFPTLFFVDSQSESFLSEPFYGCKDDDRLRSEIDRMLRLE